MNFYSVAVKDKWYSIRVLDKFEFPSRASNKTHLESQHFSLATFLSATREMCE